MRKTIRTELYKALTNKMFLLALGIGCLFCGMDALENIPKIQEFHAHILKDLESDLPLSTGHTGYSLFYLWMGLCPYSRGSTLFYTIWPVLAAMAYGWSYMEERRSGVYDQIASRTGKRTCYLAKYIAVFVSGGLAVALPVLLGLLANAMVLPFDQFGSEWNLLGNGDFMAGLFYRNLWAFALVWIGVQFLLGGATACLCFIVGTKLRYGVMVMLTPYALYVAVDAVIGSLRTSVLSGVNLVLSPLRMIYATPGWDNPEWLVFLMLGGLTSFSFLVGYWQVVKHELV